MAEIVLDHVAKNYAGGAAAVKDLSIAIADGEFVLIVGPSGCGKSTTLNRIAGLEDISPGELNIESGFSENHFVARFSAESKAVAGQTAELAFDTAKLTLFDADTGANLSIQPAE